MLYLNHFCIIRIAEWFFPARPPCHIEAITKTFKLLFVKQTKKSPETKHKKQWPKSTQQKQHSWWVNHSHRPFTSTSRYLACNVPSKSGTRKHYVSRRKRSSRSNSPRISFRRQQLEKCACTQWNKEKRLQATTGCTGLAKLLLLKLVCTPASAAERIWGSRF